VCPTGAEKDTSTARITSRLAKQGVPALHFLHPGAEYRDRPPDYGQRMRDRYTA